MFPPPGHNTPPLTSIITPLGRLGRRSAGGLSPGEAVRELVKRRVLPPAAAVYQQRCGAITRPFSDLLVLLFIFEYGNHLCIGIIKILLCTICAAGHHRKEQHKSNTGNNNFHLVAFCRFIFWNFTSFNQPACPRSTSYGQNTSVCSKAECSSCALRELHHNDRKLFALSGVGFPPHRVLLVHKHNAAEQTASMHLHVASKRGPGGGAT